MALVLAQPLGAQPALQRAATPTPTLTANLLRNGGFEGVFSRQWNAANNVWVNGRVAEGWTAWWREPTGIDGGYPRACEEDGASCQPWHAPEYRETKGIPYSPPRIRSGDNSQLYFTSLGLHEGGLYQKVSGVPKGWRVQFNVWVRVWSSDDSTDTVESKGQPGLHLRVGVDPAGGIDPWGEPVVWSAEFEAFDGFEQASVEAMAQSDSVTVFFRSAPERPLKHIDVVLDDAELIPIGPPPPTPFVIDSPEDVAGPPAATAPSGKIVTHIVQPGDTLFAIAQRYRADLAALYTLNSLNETSVLRIGQAIQVPIPGQAAPTATPLPPTPVPIAVGTLCVGAFEDVAGDGRYGDGDPALPGAAFIVADASGAAVAASTGARCFDTLPVGTYAVLAQMPAGYLATTDTRWGVALTEAARVDVAVGGRRVEGPEAEPSGAEGVPAVVVGAGLVVLIGLLTVVRRRRGSHDDS